MDLDLDNYELDELLLLFKLRTNFTAEEFRAAKRIVLAVHPDKSGLGPEYFVFFSKAYKLLDYVNKTKHNTAQSYELETDAAKETLAKQFSESDDFLSKFNTLFEQHYVKTEDECRGHGEWLKSTADMDMSFDARKRESRAIVIGPIEAAGSFSLRAANLDGDNYVDLKRSYTIDTVIGVSEADLQERPSLETLRGSRASVIAPLSRDDATREFSARADAENAADTRRAFKLVKQDQSAKRQNFWARLT